MKPLTTFLSKLSSKNQIVIPTKARDWLQVQSGDEIALIPKDGALIMIKKPKSYKKALSGILENSKGAKLLKHLTAERSNW